MSREIRRVPTDFDWPLKKTWGGYLRPDELDLPECPDCKHGGAQSTGYSAEAHAIANTFYPHQISWNDSSAERLAWKDKLGQAEVDNLLAEGRLRTWTKREPTDDNPRTGEWRSIALTAEQVNASNRSDARAFGDYAHDALNRWILIRFRCERLGITLDCATCAGETHIGTPEQVAAHELWEPAEPPTGDGWQVWETVSEGSPISSIFADREGVIGFLMSDQYYGFGTSPTPLTREQAENFVATGSSIGSFLMTSTGEIINGDAALSRPGGEPA
ncbi:hypothetical protein [Rhodococcus erythropolis]|uniref:hypothetical protein n=1 Tax=Rhodococcus erythropolis TaxID=1833 RepID=UPI00222733EF|nr:hypothetical protein [Rhodococcus erythropolis]MCW2300704.1 hypothetical protein [Rhodococcus erythropolis]